MEDTKHIFISYSRRDGEQHAVLLETKLQEAGFKTWRDVRGIDPDKDFTAEIETAIEDASHVLVCVTPDSKRSDSYVRREIQYALVLGKPVLPLRFVEILPHVPIITFEWLEFFRDWDVAFVRLCAIVRGKAHDFISQKSGNDPFRPYLESLYKRIVRFLDQAVIKLIDLTPEDTPDAVNAPPRRKDMLDLFFEAQGIGEEKSAAPKPFHTFTEAFEHYGGRVLLLGEPGAGKTITLFAFARDAVARRLNDVNAPLPLLGLISSWDAENQTLLAEWLTEGNPELDAQVVTIQIGYGKALLLLDGLDELGSERPIDPEKPDGKKFDPRRRFMEQIPTKNQVLVTCRIQDYQEIGDRVGLSGAATLRPLNAEQMRVYLVEQPELWEAVQKDDGLREMLQTPLLLSFFAFAYKGMNDDDRQQLSDLSKSPGTLRNKIFEHYVHERFQHEERKLDQRLVYGHLAVHHVLGQVAMENIRTWGRENQLSRAEIQDRLGAEPTEFIQQCQQLHLLVNLDRHNLRFMHLRLRDYFAVQPLIDSLSDVDKYARRRSIKALGQIRDARAVAPLVTSLNDIDTQVRYTTIEVLGRIGDVRAVEPLLSMLDDTDGLTRYSAVDALGWIGDVRAVESLIAVLRDTDGLVRYGATKALKRIGLPAVESLIAVLRDTDEEVRYNAVETLGWIGDARAVEPLLSMLDDIDAKVRCSVVEVLGWIGDARAVEPLLSMLDDIDAKVKRNAIVALGRIRDARAVKPLIVNLDDTDWYAQEKTIEALKQIGTPEALQVVRKWWEKQGKKQR